MGRVGDASALLKGAIEVCAVGADGPQRADSTKGSRAWKPGSTEEAEIQTLGEGGRGVGGLWAVPSHGQTGQGPVTNPGCEPRLGRGPASGRQTGRKETPLGVYIGGREDAGRMDGQGDADLEGCSE